MTILIITGLALGFVISYLLILFFRFAERIQKRYLAIVGIVYYFSINVGAIILTNFIEGSRIFGIIEKKERTVKDRVRSLILILSNLGMHYLTIGKLINTESKMSRCKT